MSALSFPRRLPVTRRWPATLAALVAAVVLGAVCARVAISSHYGKAAVEALAGAPFLVWVFRRPAAALLVLVAVVASLPAYGNLPRVSLPGHPPINVADVMLAAAVGGTLWRRAWRNWPPIAQRFVLAFAVVFALSLVATIKTLSLGHVQQSAALYDLRNWFYLLAALTVMLELRGERLQTFLDGAIGLAALVSIAAVAGAASASVQHFLVSASSVSVYSATDTSAATGVDIGSISRIRVQGLFFIYWLVIPTFVLVLTDPRRRAYRTICLALMAAAIGVSLNRNMYGGALIGLVITGALAGTRVRMRLTLTLIAGVLAVVILFLSSVSPAITSQIGKRASTVLAPSQVLSSNSAIDRKYELAYALPSIARHPWFGVGPRQGYGALLSPYADNIRFFVQDLYLWLATDFGIPTALAFLLLPGICLWFGLTRLRLADSIRQRGLLAACIGSLVAMLLSAAVDVFGQDPSSTVAFGLAFGAILAVGLQTHQRGTDTSAVDGRTTRGAGHA